MLLVMPCPGNEDLLESAHKFWPIIQVLTQCSCIGGGKSAFIGQGMTSNGDLEVLYRNAGYLRYERTYKIIYMHNDYLVVCPEFRSGEKGVEPIVIIPEFLIPGRPYQIEVYLFAIDIYSTFPEKGQRWAAKETRKRFKLKTFSHTTLGRALKWNSSLHL